MWMLKSNDHGHDQFKTSTDHPVFGRKLRPLMPRPSTNCCSAPFSTISAPCSCICNPNSLPWSHHQPISALMGSYHGVKREMMERVPLVTTRWNPTPEQLHALEDMYRRGITTPSAEQIQQIAAKLRRFGKIEGKNVFYWFQNHKARERQKKRRHLESLAGKERVSALATDKQTGLSRRSHFEFEHQSKLPTPSNSNTLSEDSESMHGAVIAECKADEWTQLKQNIVTATKEACWKLDLSPCLSPNNSVNNITAQKISGQENAEPFATVNPNTLLMSPKNDNINLESGMKENHTLQLFPIGRSDFSTEGAAPYVPCMGTRFRPNEFIEFLPTKN